MTLMDEINRTSPCWVEAFKRMKAYERMHHAPANTTLDLADAAWIVKHESVTGWYKQSRRASWHRWEIWFKNAFFFTPVCGTAIRLERRHQDRLKPRETLPLNAKICKGCAAQPIAPRKILEPCMPDFDCTFTITVTDVTRAEALHVARNAACAQLSDWKIVEIVPDEVIKSCASGS